MIKPMVSSWLLAMSLLAVLGSSCDKLGGAGGDTTATTEADEEAPAKKKKKKKADDESATPPVVTFQAPTGSPTGPGGIPLGPPPAPAPTQGAVDYFGDSAASIPAKFKERFPQGARALEVNLYPTYVFTNVQDQAQRTHVDRYQLRDGRWKDPEPVRLMGNTKTEADINAAVFDPSEVVFADIPKLIKDTLSRVKVESPTISHVSVKRPLPFDKEVTIKVFVNGPRSNGWADYDKKGTFIKAHD